jgi:Ca2+-binding RTX toxin-like protein
MMDLGGGMGMGTDPMGNVILGMDMGPMGPDIFIMGGPGEEIHGHIGDIFGDPIFFGPDPDDPYVDNYIEPTTTTTTVTFSEVVTATTGNDALEGATGNTNFTMAQGTTLGGTDTATDQGGTDGMTFENINNANIKVALVAGGTTVAYAKEGLTYDAGTAIGQVSFTDIENLYVQDSIGGAAQKLSLDMSALTGTGIAVAGTNAGNDTIDLSGESGYLGAQLWGQGGNDTISGGAAGDSIYGGAGADTITPNAGQDRIYLGTAGDIDKVIFEDESNFGSGPGASKHDMVYEFETGVDKIQFSLADFTGIASATNTPTFGTDKTANTVVVDQAAAGVGGWGASVTAGHANQRFLYNSTSGELYYDGDGNVATISPILVCQLYSDNTGTSTVDLASGDINIVA